MRGGIFRNVFAAALVALLALVLGACGGDDETTSSQDTTAQQEQGSTGKGETAQPGKGGDERVGGGSGAAKGAGTGGQASAPIDPVPLEVSGGGSEQFRVKGGDNSIQAWGEESDGSQLEAAAAQVHGFYVARANEEWAKACEYLGAPLLQQLREFAAQSGKEIPCPQMLKMLTRHPLPASVRREATIVDAGSLRIGEDNSFLIYRGVDRTVFAMPVVEEDGAWKVTLLSPTTLG